jgi:hypothetical protein
LAQANLSNAQSYTRPNQFQTLSEFQKVCQDTSFLCRQYHKKTQLGWTNSRLLCKITVSQRPDELGPWYYEKNDFGRACCACIAKNAKLTEQKSCLAHLIKRY